MLLNFVVLTQKPKWSEIVLDGDNPNLEKEKIVKKIIIFKEV